MNRVQAGESSFRTPLKGIDSEADQLASTFNMVVESLFFFFSSRRRHTRSLCDWSSDVCSSDLDEEGSGRVGRGRTAVKKKSSSKAVKRQPTIKSRANKTSSSSSSSSSSPSSSSSRSEERRVGKEYRSRCRQERRNKKVQKKDDV